MPHGSTYAKYVCGCWGSNEVTDFLRFPTLVATMEVSSSSGSLDGGAAQLEGLGISGVLHSHRAGGWSPLPLPSELLLASHGGSSLTHHRCLSVWRYLG